MSSTWPLYGVGMNSTVYSVCVICGKLFPKSINNRKITCGPVCSKKRQDLKLKELSERRRVNRKIVHKVCDICGKTFVSKSRTHKRCSPKCSQVGLQIAIENQTKRREEKKRLKQLEKVDKQDQTTEYSDE